MPVNVSTSSRTEHEKDLAVLMARHAQSEVARAEREGPTKSVPKKDSDETDGSWADAGAEDEASESRVAPHKGDSEPMVTVRGMGRIPAALLQETKAVAYLLKHPHQAGELCKYGANCRLGSKCKFVHLIENHADAVAQSPQSAKGSTTGPKMMAPGVAFFKVDGVEYHRSQFIENKGLKELHAKPQMCTHGSNCRDKMSCPYLHLKEKTLVAVNGNMYPVSALVENPALIWILRTGPQETGRFAPQNYRCEDRSRCTEYIYLKPETQRPKEEKVVTVKVDRCGQVDVKRLKRTAGLMYFLANPEKTGQICRYGDRCKYGNECPFLHWKNN